MRLPDAPPSVSGAPPTPAASPEIDGRYLHWDELRHRPPPAGLDHQRWWASIRMARIRISRPLALADSVGRPFTFAMTDTVQRLVHELDRDASGRIELPEPVTDRATRDRYIVHSLIEEAITSSQLEGAATTRLVAKEMIRTGRDPRTPDERMIVNNYRALEWIRDHVSEPLTRDLVLELHSIVTAGALDKASGSGRFRRADEVVRVVDVSDGTVLHEPPAANGLEARMRAMCDFANGGTMADPFVHPVMRAILLHFWLAYDHPFVDGNGRTARALFYWSMLRQGYWLTEYVSISSVIKRARAQYDRAYLYTETDGNDATYFVLHQLKVLRLAIDELFEYLRTKAEQLRQLAAQLRLRDDLNHRQLALVEHAVRHPDARYTIEGHKTSHRVVYQTARTDLLGLVALGLLSQAKRGKKLVFSATPDLAKRLGGKAKR